MSPEYGQAWFRIGVFLVLTSLAILPWLPADSAERIVAFLALGSGLALLAGVAVIIKLSNR